MNLEFKGSWLKYIIDTFLLYNGGTGYMLLYLFAILLILINKNKWMKNLFLYPIIITFITIFNPLLVRYIFNRLDLWQRYYRFIWLLPMSIVIAFIATELISKAKNRIIYSIAVCATVIILIVAGNLPMRIKTYRVTDDKYKISKDVIAVSQIIHKDSKVKQPIVAYEDDLMVEYRTYDPAVISAFGRDDAMSNVKITKDYIDTCESRHQYNSLLYALIGYGYQLPYNILEESIKCKNVDYMVINKNFNLNTYLLKEPMVKEISAYGNYIVYKVIKDKAP